MSEMAPENTITYCANGCHKDGLRVQTTAPDLICRRCDNQLHGWFADIPNNYSLLPRFVEHGTTERNPDSVATKAAYAPAPMRLEIIDLLDTRLGRKWNGTAPADERRGALGTLQAHVDALAEGRNLTDLPESPTVTSACRLLQRHRLWLIQQEWIKDLFAEIKTLNRQLADAVGDYRRPPVGRCHILHETAEKPCGGPLFANPFGGVRCTRCGATWDSDHLRQLGLAQAEAQAEEDAEWLTGRQIEAETGVKVGTVRVWANRGLVGRRQAPVGVTYSVTDVRARSLGEEAG